MKNVVNKIKFLAFMFFLLSVSVSWGESLLDINSSGVEYVKLIEKKSYLIKDRTVTFEVEYSAETEREIFIQLNELDNNWIGKVKHKVSAGYNKKIKITLVADQRIDPGRGYKVKLNLGVVGGTWKELLDKNLYSINLHKSKVEMLKSTQVKKKSNKLEFVRLIEKKSYLVEGRAIVFQIEYSAEEDREVFIQINGKKSWVGKTTVKIKAGKKQKVDVMFVADVRVNPGKNYKMKLNLGVVDGDWDELIDKNIYNIHLHKNN